MRTRGPNGARLGRSDLPGWHMGQLPRDLVVDAACPECGKTEAWRCVQTLGDIPGMPGVPAAGSGVQYRCGACGAEAVYRERALDDKEIGQRNAILLRGGRRP